MATDTKPRTTEQEIERLNALIERWSNWLIQDRGGDHDYIRQYVRQLEAQRDALR